MKLITTLETGSTIDQARSLGWSYWEIFREFVQNAMDIRL
mgnify:CR=1 FL=1